MLSFRPPGARSAHEKGPFDPMAKRSRVSGRPAQRRPSGRPSSRPPGAARPTAQVPTPPPIPAASLTDAELARAAELEAELVAEEKAATAARETARRATRVRGYAGPVSNEPLSVRMAHEYAYVARDVRRIGLTAILMAMILAILAVLVDILGIVKL